MKRFFKLSAYLLSVVLLALFLCSCNALDEAKANRAIYNEDKSVITFRDNEYRKMDIGKYEFIIDYDSSNVYYVTTPDVPVLLASSFGDQIFTNKDLSILKYSNNRSYVRGDQYDAVKKAVDSAELDRYFFNYTDFDAWDGDGDYAPTKYVMLDDKQTAVINKALNASEKEKFKYTELSDGAYDIKTIRLSVCDNDMLLTDAYTTYYIFRDGSKYCFWDGKTYKENCIYQFKGEDEKMIEDIFDQNPNGLTDDNIRWRIGYEPEINEPQPVDAVHQEG